MISDKIPRVYTNIIKRRLEQIRLNLEMMEKNACCGDGFVEYLREDSVAKIGIIKRHLADSIARLERGKGMKYKYVKYHANYDLTLDKVYEGFKYKEGWILVRGNDRGGNTLYREECFKVVK